MWRGKWPGGRVRGTCPDAVGRGAIMGMSGWPWAVESCAPQAFTLHRSSPSASVLLPACPVPAVFPWVVTAPEPSIVGPRFCCPPAPSSCCLGSQTWCALATHVPVSYNDSPEHLQNPRDKAFAPLCPGLGIPKMEGAPA